jgi:hypothetical protein
MGKIFDGIDERLERWMAAQPMFFVGTAPLDSEGHVNVSPKGPVAPEARRAIVTVELERVADSCGYTVPLMSYHGRRPHMDLWAAKKLRVGGPDALVGYQREKNLVSIDGLPAVELPVPVVE